MASLGWRHEFRERSWAEVRSFLGSVDWREFEGDYLIDIIDSVTASGADQLVALTTSMHDLVVAPRPVGEPPLDVVIVRAPGSLRASANGTVRIERLAPHGDTDMVCPVEEAVPLFWRFLDVEFGIRSQTPDPTP